MCSAIRHDCWFAIRCREDSLDINQAPYLKARCSYLSLRVEALCGLLVFSEVALLLHTILVVKGDEFSIHGVWATLFLTWLLWIATQIENYRLVKCGPHAHRYRLAHQAINRPEFAVRMAFHLVINWSAIFVTLVAGHIIRGSAVAETVASACIVATLGVWVVFNVLHRKVNRLRNLAFTTAISFVLILMAVNLLATLRLIGGRVLT